MPRKRRHIQLRLYLKRARQKRELESARWQRTWQNSWNVDIRFDTSQSLQGLEGKNWGNLPRDASPLVETCHRLHRKPLKDFTAGDLCTMIFQNIGLPFLVPLAIRQLKDHPLVEGKYCRGDLLASLLHIEADFWRTHPDVRRIMEEIVAGIDPLTLSLSEVEKDALERALKVFRGS